MPKRSAPAPWKRVTRLDAWYQDDGDPTLVGGLVLARDGRVYFQYEADWLSRGTELSPQQLPLSVGRDLVPAPDPRRMHGLHGLFADALPDRWGMRVLDASMRRHGIDPVQAGPLDRLAWLGTRTMGALTFRPATQFPAARRRAASLDRLAAAAERLHEGRVDQESVQLASLEELERAGGTAGGDQPKVLVAEGPHGKLLAGGEPPRGYVSYLLKFTPRRDGLGLRTDCGQLEEVYARMARAAGVAMPPSRLFRTSDGRQHFAVERFDRTLSGGRRHVHTFGGLLGREAGDDGDYDELLRVARALTGTAAVLEDVLRRLCFNIAAVNDDDHLKNTAFLHDPSAGWTLAPAYDVTFSPSRAGERGMSVAGFAGNVTWSEVEQLAVRHGVPRRRFREIVGQTGEVMARWPTHAASVGLSDVAIAEVSAALKRREQSLLGR